MPFVVMVQEYEHQFVVGPAADCAKRDGYWLVRNVVGPFESEELGREFIRKASSLFDETGIAYGPEGPVRMSFLVTKLEAPFDPAEFADEG